MKRLLIFALSAVLLSPGVLFAQSFGKQTYAASTATKLASAAGTAPFFAICGSSTKTIRVRQIVIDYTIGTAGLHADPILQKTSTAPSGGTPVVLTQVPLDSNYAAGTAAVASFYSALPTTGTVVGVIASQMVWGQITATVTAGSQNPRPFLFRSLTEGEAIVLRGVAQCVQAAFGTTTTNAPTLTVSVIWTEE